MKKCTVHIFFSVLLAGCMGTNEKNYEKPVILASEMNKRWEIVNSIKDSVQEGDLVVRCGNDQTSFTLSDFSQQEKLYSHSGIAIKGEDNRIYIYHNMAGELNPGEIMRRDPVDSFLTPGNNVAFGVYRYDLSGNEKEKLRSIVYRHFQNKLQFDMNFDLESDDKMYCVEMIAKSINEATRGRIVFSKSQVNKELKQKYMKMALQKKVIPSPRAAEQREYLAIDNLYLNPHCRKVYRHEFEVNKGLISIPPPENGSN